MGLGVQAFRNSYRIVDCCIADNISPAFRITHCAYLLFESALPVYVDKLVPLRSFGHILPCFGTVCFALNHADIDWRGTETSGNCHRFASVASVLGSNGHDCRDSCNPGPLMQ